ncbi:MAG: glycosyltransferase family 4 protein, partial [Candidatus Omnitrophota bacterium]
SDFFTPDPALRSWAAHETLKILFAGRLVDAQKKISTLLEAIRGLEQVHLTIVGDGPDRSLLAEQVKRLRLEAHVRFAGWLDKVALRRAYQEANAYVSASLYEGMSNTALEAMSCGLPLILSDIPGHQELVVSRENGLLFGPGDHGQLAEFLTGLSADAALGAAMSRQGRRLACERFSWSELARQHLDLFAAALRAKR